MKIKVSKAFAKYINSMKKELRIAEAKYVEVSPEFYKWNVGNILDAGYYGDVNNKNGMCKAICIIYPEEYYAGNLYISTQMLNFELRDKDVRDETGLKRMLHNMIEI